MGQPIILPAPLKGLNTVESDTIAFNSGYAREFTNFGLYNSKAYLRPGVLSYVYNASLGLEVYWYDIASKIAILSDGTIRDLDDGSGATNIGGNPQTKATQVKHASLDLVIGLQAPRLAANPFTASTFTTSTITFTAVIAACSHKGRFYVTDGTTIEYSAIAQITGAMQGKTNISSFLNGQLIQRMFSVSLSSNGQNNVLVVFGNGGKVLVYAGDYPAASNWQLIGSYDMAVPASNTSYVEIDGNIWISTKQYPYWILDVINGSPSYAYDNSPGKKIEDLWEGQTWLAAMNPEDPHTFYDPNWDAIICMCSQMSFQFANYGNEAIYFAYFRKYNAWSVWAMAPFFWPVRLDSANVVYGTTYRSEMVRLDSNSWIDQRMQIATDYDIFASWKTPYIGAFKGTSTKVNSVRPYFKNSVSGYLHEVRVISDYSDSGAPFGFYTQPTVTDIPPLRSTSGAVDLPANASTFYNSKIDLGGDGDSDSVQFIVRLKSRLQATQGTIQLLAANINLDTGGAQS